MPNNNASSDRAPLADRGDDLYETPSVATEALLRHEVLPKRIWEPSCGRGAISQVLTDHGHYVVSQDLVEYGYGLGRCDFLMEIKPPLNVACIVTNPPFKLACEFITHGLLLVPKVVMLLRFSILEGQRKKFTAFDDGTLARVYVFRNRLPRMHRDGWEGPKASSSVAYAWMVFDRNHRGPTTLHRISWEPSHGKEKHDAGHAVDGEAS